MGWQRGPFHIYFLNEQMEEGGGLGRKKGKGLKCEVRRKEKCRSREVLEGCWAQHREDPVAGEPGHCRPPAPTDVWIPPIAPSPVTISPLWNPQKQVTERDSHLFLRERD